MNEAQTVRATALDLTIKAYGGSLKEVPTRWETTYHLFAELISSGVIQAIPEPTPEAPQWATDEPMDDQEN